MVSPIYFAQATQAPNNGASNAEDFQPLTRSPQTAGGGLQPGVSAPQSTSGQEILSNPNSTISITRNPAEPAEVTAVPNGGINWLFVIIVSVVIVLVADYWLRRRDRRKSSLIAVATASTEALTDEPALVPEEKPQQPEEPEEPAPEQSTPPKKSSSKKKSKSKRKHK